MEKYLRETKMLDYSSKNIQRLIQERNWNDIEVFERLKSIYNFVRDEILFGYNIDDNISASKVLADGYGQCNTKGTLFMALLRACSDKIVGAVWVRIMNDYGHIDNETPSFAISLLKEYRNYGIGTELMKQMLTKLKLEGYKQASLSVQKMNYAVRMYRKIGFEIVDENDEEYIMICKL